MSKHTQGPWAYMQLGDGDSAAYVLMARGDPLSLVGPQGEQNARLIAAAPDLLAALQRIVDIRGSTGGHKAMVTEFQHIAATALAKVQA